MLSLHGVLLLHEGENPIVDLVHHSDIVFPPLREAAD